MLAIECCPPNRLKPTPQSIFMSKFLTLSFVLLFVSSVFAQDPARLAQDGKTEWRIYLPAAAGEVERFAGDELKRYFHRVSGAELGAADDARKDSIIHVGLRTSLSPDLKLPAPKAGYDGYTLSISPRRIVIAGDNAIGVLYGVYELLERMGCRWYQPTLDPKDPEVVPRNASPVVAGGEWTEASPLKLRIYNGSAFFFDLYPDQMLPQLDWAAKNRYNGVSWQAHHRPGAVGEEMELMKKSGILSALDQRGLFLHGPCHSFPFFLPTEKYFEKHPEWFGLLEGKRRVHGGEYPAVNYCWSNAEANEEFMKNVEVFLQEYRQIKVFCPVWIDGGKLCGCDACQKRGGSDLIVDLFNLMSERLEKSCPWVTLEAVTGYAPALDPPQKAKPNGKWQAVFAHWGRHHAQAYGDAHYSNRTNLIKWQAVFKNFEICSYYAAASHQPFNGAPFLHALEKDTEYFVTNKLVGSYVLQYPHGFWWNFAFDLAVAGQYPYYYPQRKPQMQMRDYVTNYFGPQAGPLLQEYFQALANDLDVSYRASRGDANPRDLQELKRLAGMIKQALSASADDEVFAYRVRKLQAAHRIISRWGSGQQHTRTVKEKLEGYQAGRGTREEMEKAFAAAEVYAANVLGEAADQERKFPGTVSAEWLEGWYVNRLVRNPIKEAERRFAGVDENYKALRKQAADRKRRIVFNNDGNEPVVICKSVSEEELLKHRATPLIGSQVDSIFYCTWSSGFGLFTHDTKVGAVFNTREAMFSNNLAQAYLDAGIDPLRVMTDFGKKNNMEVFWSFRLNDTHDASSAAYGPVMFRANKLKQEHPEYLIGSKTKRPKFGTWTAMDFGEPDVRELAYRYCQEVCRNYDVDGIEIDFFRHAFFFKCSGRGGPCKQTETDHMTGLMQRIRHMTEVEGAKRKRPILVAMRVPDSVEYCKTIGIDLERWLREGLLDLLVVSGYTQLNAWDYSVQLGRKYGVKVYPSLDEPRVKDEAARKLRGQPATLRGRAMNAWASGLDGIYTFNFFDAASPLLREMGDPEELRRHPRNYFASVRGVGSVPVPHQKFINVPTLNPGSPLKIAAKESVSVSIMTGEASSELGDKFKATLRLQFQTSAKAEDVRVVMNGNELDGLRFVGAWLEADLNRSNMIKGKNVLEITNRADKGSLILNDAYISIAPPPAK